MEINLTLTQADWYGFQKYIFKKKQKEIKGFLGGFWFNLILWFCLTILFLTIFRFMGKLHYPTAIFVFLFFTLVLALSIWNNKKLRRAVAPSEEGTFIGKHHFTFNEEGIHSEGKNYKSLNNWNAVKSIEQGNGMIMIFIDTAYAFIFPENQLDDPVGFLKTIKRFQV